MDSIMWTAAGSYKRNYFFPKLINSFKNEEFNERISFVMLSRFKITVSVIIVFLTILLRKKDFSRSFLKWINKKLNVM